MFINREELNEVRKVYPKGTRVRLLQMDGESIPIGTEGTVTWVDDAATIHVRWDNGSSLGVLFGVDWVEVV